MTLTHYIGGKITGDSTDFASLSINYPNLTTFIDFETFAEYILVDGVWKKIGEPLRNMDDGNLKTYWKFDESSPNDIINVSQAFSTLGSPADLQITGATYKESGIPANNNSLLFNGTSDFGQAGNSLSQFNFLHDGSTWTINFWLKWVSGDTVIDTTDGGASSRVGLLIEIQATGALTTVMTNGTNQIVSGSTSAGFIPSDGNFHFYSMRWDNNLASENLKISRDDGVPETFNKTGFTPSSADAAFPLSLAQRPNSGGRFLNGNFTEFSMFSRILADSEVTSLYNNGNGLAIYQ